MKINLVCVGNLKEKYWQEACSEYVKRLSRFCDLNIIEIKEQTQKEDNINIKNEGEAIINRLSGYVIALCVEGKKFSSESFYEKIENISLKRNSTITFVIGSSNGLDNSVKEKADLKISFSDMTFPHQLIRIILLEQIYRVFTIKENIKYHK